MSRPKSTVKKGKKQQGQEHAAARALARSRVFGLLARALRYPDEELFASLRDSGWAVAVAEAAQKSGMPDQDVFMVELQRLQETLPAELGDLQGLHTALFSSGNVCPHQESDYVASHAFQITDIMADVAGFYSAFGVRISRSQRELPDFLGTELEFLHFVGWKEANALREGNRNAAVICREAQEKFLTEHLGAWVTRFRERIESCSAGRFYVLLARLIERFVGAQGTQTLAIPERG